MITKRRFDELEQALRDGGHGPAIDWSASIAPPANAEDFACRTIYVICNAGMRVAVGAVIAAKCIAALKDDRSATAVFGHPGKAHAIDRIWSQREELFEGYRRAGVKLDFLAGLPWIGPITRLHLAKNLGASAAKPDVHLLRLANREATTPARLCRRLSRLTGRTIAAVDTVLWRACAERILDSRKYELESWHAAFNGTSSQELPKLENGRGS